MTATDLVQDRAELRRQQRAERWRAQRAKPMSPEVTARVERDRAALEAKPEPPKPKELDDASTRAREMGRSAEIRESTIMLDTPVLSGTLKIVGVSSREQLAEVLL